jgi:large subunit ribosomal protein L8e
MGKVVLSQRRGKGSVYRAHTCGRQGAVAMKRYDYAERHGYVKGVVKEIVHDSGRGAPIAKVQFKDSYNFKRINTLLCAPEGLYSGQFIFAGKRGKTSCYCLFIFG